MKQDRRAGAYVITKKGHPFGCPFLYVRFQSANVIFTGAKASFTSQRSGSIIWKVSSASLYSALGQLTPYALADIVTEEES